MGKKWSYPYYYYKTANSAEPETLRFRWFRFWWLRKHRNWIDNRQKKKAMAKEWERRNKR